jgi:spoIIIJ-associated protein
MISGKGCGILIGRRGETLDALQYLTSLVVNRECAEYRKVTIDIENYRKKREEALVRLAKNLADRAVQNKKNITLEPMNPYERKIIHSTLQNNKYVETYSIGDDPNRKVVIALR